MAFIYMFVRQFWELNFLIPKCNWPLSSYLLTFKEQTWGNISAKMIKERDKEYKF